MSERVLFEDWASPGQQIVQQTIAVMRPVGACFRCTAACALIKGAANLTGAALEKANASRRQNIVSQLGSNLTLAEASQVASDESKQRHKQSPDPHRRSVSLNCIHNSYFNDIVFANSASGWSMVRRSNWQDGVLARGQLIVARRKPLRWLCVLVTRPYHNSSANGWSVVLWCDFRDRILARSNHCHFIAVASGLPLFSGMIFRIRLHSKPFATDTDRSADGDNQSTGATYSAHASTYEAAHVAWVVHYDHLCGMR